MAGVTDIVFREICRELGADFAVAEMVASKPELRASVKSSTRHAQAHETTPRIVQLLGTDPQELVDAALWQASQGAQVIDLNLGCPAKKVCNVAAGSALMAYPDKVNEIFSALRQAVSLPLTVKIRTGTDELNKNALEIALLAEQNGFNAISIHGRTRENKFLGHAEYETIRQVKQAINLPVFANGDISSPEMAQFVLKYTHANGLLIGRGAQGYPWIFREIKHFLIHQTPLAKPTLHEFKTTLLKHLEGLYQLYGVRQGPRIARKHIGWYAQHLEQGERLRKQFNRLDTPLAQQTLTKEFFNT
jgi:tRNA-dihydrouridine synthase B